MILLPPAVRIFVATRVTDMRLSFDRLAGSFVYSSGIITVVAPATAAAK